jgi:hypothetical protein
VFSPLYCPSVQGSKNLSPELHFVSPKCRKMYVALLEFDARNICIIKLCKTTHKFHGNGKVTSLLDCCTIFVQVFRNELCTKVGDCLYCLVIKRRCFQLQKEIQSSPPQHKNSE